MSRSKIRSSLHYIVQVERLLPKLLSGSERRSLLKYIINTLLSDFEYFIEKVFGLSTRVWIPIHGVLKLLPRGQTLGAKSAAM